jgi:hypothetical protein
MQEEEEEIIRELKCDKETCVSCRLACLVFFWTEKMNCFRTIADRPPLRCLVIFEHAWTCVDMYAHISFYFSPVAPLPKNWQTICLATNENPLHFFESRRFMN